MSSNHPAPREKLGDFTATARILPISILATLIGVISAFVALALAA